MTKYFGIYSKRKVYIGTIVPIPPVMGVRKISYNIPETGKHIWLKVFLNKPIKKFRDVRKSQVSTSYNKKVIAI